MLKAQTHNLVNLVRNAKNGNRASLERLLTLFHEEVFRLVYYRTGSPMDTEDLTQEIFIEMSRSISSLKDPRRFKAWLYRIALNRVRDFHRKRRLQSFFTTTSEIQDTESSGNSYNPLDHVLEKEFWHQFHSIIQKMSTREREVFLLRYIDQLGIREIAETLQKSESAVKTHLYRALKKFRKAAELRTFIKGSSI